MRRAATIPGIRQALSSGLRMMLMLNVPATLGLLALATPIVRLIFERGRFTPADTAATAAALVCYAPGLMGYSAVKLVSPSYYAMGHSRIPVDRERGKRRVQRCPQSGSRSIARSSRPRAGHGGGRAAERRPAPRAASLATGRHRRAAPADRRRENLGGVNRDGASRRTIPNASCTSPSREMPSLCRRFACLAQSASAWESSPSSPISSGSKNSPM